MCCAPLSSLPDSAGRPHLWPSGLAMTCRCTATERFSPTRLQSRTHGRSIGTTSRAALFVYLLCFVPAEIVVDITRNAHGGIVVYRLLHFAAPLVGLLATWAADRSKGHVIFVYACLSTACLSPLVFGFPTELWIAHALFWPTLAICHYAREGIGGFGLVLAALLALVLTHEGAMILAVAVVATLLLRGARSAPFRRATRALLIVTPIWILAEVAFRPDSYYVPVFASAALHFFDATIFENELLLLLLGTLASYWIALSVLRSADARQGSHLCHPDRDFGVGGLLVMDRSSTARE